jgi:co-chaperonin GroES (HSP10)
VALYVLQESGNQLIQPRNDRVLIERLIEPHTGLIIAPQIAEEKSIKGKVVAVGPKCDTVKPGMHVLFNSKWNDFANDFYDDLPLEADKKLHLVQEADKLGILP